jgi:hypothetical protein
MRTSPTVFILAFVLFISITTTIRSQPFEIAHGKDGNDFKSLQRGFAEWKKDRDLNTSKYWKYYKRWEQEMQLHTNAQGEPQIPMDYFEALQEKASNGISERNASTGVWYPIGPFAVPNNLTGYMENGIGRVNCTAFHPSDSNTWFVGVAQGGLWKTANNGQSYTPLTDQLPITRISDIAIDPIQPDTMYISLCDFEYVGISLQFSGRKRHTHYGLGVYKSTDGGTSWIPTGLNFQIEDGDGSLIRKIIINPANTQTLLACGVGGMYRSIDGGTTWTNQLDSLFWDMIQDPINPQKIYAATGWVKNANVGSAGIYVSNDFGLTWTLLPTGIPPRGAVQRVKLAQSPSNPNRIYALTVDLTGGLYAIYRSDNGGSSWNQTSNTLNVLEYNDGTGTGGQGNYDLGFMVHPQNPNVVYAGGINLWASTDGANTFEPAAYWTTAYGPSIHADIHDLRVHPVTGQFYLSTDGGVQRTDSIIPVAWSALQNGSTFPTVWENLSNGMNATSFYRLSSTRNSAGHLLAGSQDNATVYFDGSTWHTVLGGDGMDNAMDTAINGSFVCSYQFGGFARSDDGGLTFNYWSSNVNGENAEWTTPIMHDDANYQTYYIGYENVVKSTDNGQNWNAISSFPSAGNYGSELSAISVSQADPDVLYAARRVRYEYAQSGKLFRSANGGSTWIDITAGLPDSLFYTYVESDPSDANTVYVSLAGLQTGTKVFKSTNAGLSWTNISHNLPNVPLNCVRVVPGTGDLMVAGDIGVFRLPPGDTVWTEAGSGLPNVIVSDIEFNPALNKMIISTFGRGIWATDLSAVTGFMPSENASAPLEFLLTPNPNTGQFSLSGALSSNAKVEIRDIMGKVVHQTQFENLGSVQIKLNLNSGLYFAVIRDREKMGVQRFVVQ